MRANLTVAADFTFGEEGDYSADPRDGGNWSSGRVGVGTLVGSRFGVSAPQLIDWCRGRAVTAAMMRSLPRSTAQAIFGARYWQALRCDEVPAGLDLSLSDMGYNAGDALSGRLLQELLGFAGEDVDGWIGPQTVAAIAGSAALAGGWAAGLSSSSARAVQGVLGVPADGDVGPMTLAALASAPQGRTVALCAALADRQAAFYRSLSGFPVYGDGWLARVGRRLTAALALAAPLPN